MASRCIPSTNIRVLLCTAGLALLAGCGSGQPADSGSPTASAHPVKKAAAPSEVLSPYMVAAVPMLKAGATPVPVLLKFELQGRPQPAGPVDVDLAIVPQSATLGRVSGKVEVQDGLGLLEGAQIAPVDKPAEGAIIHHLIKVQPARDGIFSVNVTLDVESAGQTSSESFAIPVIAGAGFTDAPAAAASAAPAAGAATTR